MAASGHILEPKTGPKSSHKVNQNSDLFQPHMLENGPNVVPKYVQKMVSWRAPVLQQASFEMFGFPMLTRRLSRDLLQRVESFRTLSGLCLGHSEVS